jgi:hydrogenase nickel incorporation protein HypB
MCTTCGCGDEAGTRVTTLHDGASDHSHPDGGSGHSHAADGHHHPAEPETTRTIEIEQQVLAKNDLLAARNRDWLAHRGIRALNVMSSPGAGKTSLLVKTIGDLGADRQVAVIEGDQETLLDAERIRATGCKVVQINTGAGCHLDADMLQRGLRGLNPAAGSLLFIENVGNLVCPALFDLGETAKVVVISVTEGDDKPLKYPHMFRASSVLLLNKIDLLPYVDFDVDLWLDLLGKIKPDAKPLQVSATKGDGLDAWIDWLETL